MARLSEIDFFRSILDNLHVAVYVVDREGKILFWNDGAERITGYLRQDVIGRLHTDNFLGETDGEDNESPAISLPPRLPCATASPPRRSSPCAINQAIASLFSSGLFPCVIPTVPSSEPPRVSKKASRSRIGIAAKPNSPPTAASTKPSGVLNHGVTQSHIGENIRLFEEHHLPFSILCMEMDHLDKVLQRDGPGAIAVILRVVGTTLENTVRPTDYLGRWQANQFLAILTECSGNEIERDPKPAPHGQRQQSRLVGRSRPGHHFRRRHRRQTRRHRRSHGFPRRARSPRKHRRRRQSHQGAL